jgi:hypothetical protein
LIIGTFPIYAITDRQTVDGIVEKELDQGVAHMRFFYGSKRNLFWELFSTAFESQNPINLSPSQRVSAAKELLVDKKFLITDVIKTTNRNNESVNDKVLWMTSKDRFVNENMSLNLELPSLLNANLNIKHLYFKATSIGSKSPFGWFKEIFGNKMNFNTIHKNCDKILSIDLNIDGRLFTGFFLNTPSGN